MNNIIIFSKKIFLITLSVLLFTTCDYYENYELCNEDPAIDLRLGFQLVDINGEDLVYEGPFHRFDVSFTTPDGTSIIDDSFTDEASESIIFIINIIDIDLAKFNDMPYTLNYSSGSIPVYIDSERLINPCNVEYSSVNEIKSTNESYIKENNIYQIIIR